MHHLFFAVLLAGDWRNLIAKDSFQGWRSPSGGTPVEGAWRIENGVLSVRPFVHRRTDLWSAETYGDFELEWEWMADRAANSGIKYWVQSAVTLVIEKEDQKFRPIPHPAKAKPEEVTLEYSRGLEYQMTDDQYEPTSLKRQDSRAGGLYGLFAPSPETVKPNGEWNQSRLLVRGGQVEHWLNGKKVLAYDQGRLKARLKETNSSLRVAEPRGPIALQYHQTRVSFRKMRIRTF